MCSNIAPYGHTLLHFPHSLHCSGSMYARLFLKLIAPNLHTSWQGWETHPRHNVLTSYFCSRHWSHATEIVSTTFGLFLSPPKLSTWPKYNYYKADQKYQEIARLLGLPSSTPAEGVESLAKACAELGSSIGIKMSFAEQGISEKEFLDNVQDIALNAYEDQCTPANPRLPLVADMIEILKKAYNG